MCGFKCNFKTRGVFQLFKLPELFRMLEQCSSRRTLWMEFSRSKMYSTWKIRKFNQWSWTVSWWVPCSSRLQWVSRGSWAMCMVWIHTGELICYEWYLAKYSVSKLVITKIFQKLELNSWYTFYSQRCILWWYLIQNQQVHEN